MTAVAYAQPKFLLSHLGAKLVNMSTDTFKIGLIASGTLAARGTTEGYEFVSDLLANGGSALTEASGTGYSRLTLASVTWTLSGLAVTFSAASVVYTSPSFIFEYGWIHDETASSGTDATRPLLALIDFGGTQTASGSTYTLTVTGSGLVAWTSAA
jgi:hypothetical protein